MSTTQGALFHPTPHNASPPAHAPAPTSTDHAPAVHYPNGIITGGTRATGYEHSLARLTGITFTLNGRPHRFTSDTNHDPHADTLEPEAHVTYREHTTGAWSKFPIRYALRELITDLTRNADTHERNQHSSDPHFTSAQRERSERDAIALRRLAAFLTRERQRYLNLAWPAHRERLMNRSIERLSTAPGITSASATYWGTPDEFFIAIPSGGASVLSGLRRDTRLVRASITARHRDDLTERDALTITREYSDALPNEALEHLTRAISTREREHHDPDEALPLGATRVSEPALALAREQQQALAITSAANATSNGITRERIHEAIERHARDGMSDSNPSTAFQRALQEIAPRENTDRAFRRWIANHARDEHRGLNRKDLARELTLEQRASVIALALAYATPANHSSARLTLTREDLIALLDSVTSVDHTSYMGGAQVLSSGERLTIAATDGFTLHIRTLLAPNNPIGRWYLPPDAIRAVKRAARALPARARAVLSIRVEPSERRTLARIELLHNDLVTSSSTYQDTTLRSGIEPHEREFVDYANLDALHAASIKTRRVTRAPAAFTRIKNAWGKREVTYPAEITLTKSGALTITPLETATSPSVTSSNDTLGVHNARLVTNALRAAGPNANLSVIPHGEGTPPSLRITHANGFTALTVGVRAA